MVPEIRGWRDTLLREVAEGPRRRASRRIRLCANAVFSPLASSASSRGWRACWRYEPALSGDYRRLATALDEAASVIRILMGEALFAPGWQTVV